MPNSSRSFIGYDEHGQMLPNPTPVPPIAQKIRECEDRAVQAEWEGDFSMATFYYHMASHYRDRAAQGETHAPPF